MDQPKDKNQQLSIVVDRKHKTKYCITPSRCYIKRNNLKGERK